MNSFNVALLAGTLGEDRESIRVLKFAEKIVKERGWNPVMIDAAEYQLPMLEEVFRRMKNPDPRLTDIHHKLESADGFLFLTAEYNHSIPSALKNMIDYFWSEYFFKPSGIISYSASAFGGVRAAEQLKLVLLELKTPPIPTSLPISKVHSSIDNEGNSENGDYERRSKKFLDEFGWYMEALKTQREKGTPYK